MPKDICYKKNFLKSVVARVDFAGPVEGLDTKLSSKVIKGIMKHFPISEPKKGVAGEFQISPEKIEQKRSEFTVWSFFGKNREKTLTIIPMAVHVDYNLYTRYEMLKEEFLKTINLFLSDYPNAVCSRLGLRYINYIELEGDPFAWGDYLNDKMLGILKFYSKPQCIIRAFHNLELKFEEFNLRYQFGMHNPDYPAPIKKKGFTLDFDAYYQGPLDENDVVQNFDKFHDKIQELFELSIKEKLRKVMNG